MWPIGFWPTLTWPDSQWPYYNSTSGIIYSTGVIFHINLIQNKDFSLHFEKY